MKLLTKHLRSNAVAYLALFIALTSTSYAAIKIPNNSVGNKQLKKNAVDATKVKDGTLLKNDFKAGQLKDGEKGDKGDPGTPGQQGEQGLRGEKGDDGPPGSGSIATLTFNTGTDAAQAKPPVPPDALDIRSTPFNTGAANTTVITNGALQVELNCAGGSGACAYDSGAYIDGTPIPGTKNGTIQDVPNGTTQTDTISYNGVLAGVGQGAHSLQIRIKKTSGTGTLSMPGGAAALKGGFGYVMQLPQ